MTPGTKPRIALLFEYSTLNGGERSMLACLDEWKARPTAAEFVAIAPGDGPLFGALTDRGIPVAPWSRRPGLDLQESADSDLQLLQIVRDLQPDLLHANSLSMGRVVGRLADKLMIPTSAHLRDIIHLSSSAMRDLNRNRLLVAVSDATRRSHVDRGLDPDRVIVVRNGVDLQEYFPRPRPGRLRDELQLPEHALLVATIGQIGLRKGQDVLAAAAPLITQQVPEVHFLLIGERSSGKAESIAFERAIAQRFQEAGIADRLHRLGYRHDMPSLMAEIDLVAHPANQEPFGRVLLEAAASGLPVVATNVGGTSEIVQDGVTGRLVPPRDPRALADAGSELLADPRLRGSMGRAARSHALSEFSIANAAANLFRIWVSLVN